jgi:hypothetical protein
VDWRRLISGKGASLLYLLSALSLLLGLARIIGPVLAESYDPAKLFLSLGVLYAYELSLLGAALLIVLWRNVTDDAVSLLVLVAAFMGIGGLALETVAYDNILLAFGCGLVLLALGGGKLWAIRRWLAPGMPWVVLSVVFLILAHGYLGPVAFAKLNCSLDGPELREAWLGGWWILAIAGGVLFVAAELYPSGDARHGDTTGRGQPGEGSSAVAFARTRGMGWVLVAVLLGTAAVHQLGVAHLFGHGEDPDGFPWSWSDLLPFAALAALLAVQYRRLFGCAWRRCDEALLALPALGIAAGLAGGSYQGPPELSAEVLAHPAVLSLLIAVAVAWKAWRLKRDVPWAIAISYAALAVLALDPLPGGGVDELFWMPSAAVLAAGMALMAVLTRRVGWALAAALAGGAGVFASPTAQAAARASTVAPFALGLIAEGIALWLVQLAFPRRCPRTLGRLAPLLLLVGLVGLFGDKAPALDVAVVVIAAVLMGAVAWLRSGDRAAAVLYAGAPAWQGWRLMRTSFAWGCVMLAFLLLAGGVALSLRKGARPEPDTG